MNEKERKELEELAEQFIISFDPLDEHEKDLIAKRELAMGLLKQSEKDHDMLRRILYNIEIQLYFKVHRGK